MKSKPITKRFYTLSMPKSLEHTLDSSSTIPTTHNFEKDFPMMMATCVKCMRETLNARFAEAGYNITSEQWKIITQLATQDGISQQELAIRYDRSKASTMVIIRNLEKVGLINRQPHPVDKRANLVYLTKEGRELQRALRPIAIANIEQMSKGISKSNIELLKTLLSQITKNING